MGREQAECRVSSKLSWTVVQMVRTGWLRDWQRERSPPGPKEIGTGPTWKAAVTKSGIRSQIPGVGSCFIPRSLGWDHASSDHEAENSMPLRIWSGLNNFWCFTYKVTLAALDHGSLAWTTEKSQHKIQNNFFKGRKNENTLCQLYRWKYCINFCLFTGKITFHSFKIFAHFSLSDGTWCLNFSKCNLPPVYMWSRESMIWRLGFEEIKEMINPFS